MMAAINPDAERFNAPRHFGKTLSEASPYSEILPLNDPKLRRARGSRRSPMSDNPICGSRNAARGGKERNDGQRK